MIWPWVLGLYRTRWSPDGRKDQPSGALPPRILVVSPLAGGHEPRSTSSNQHQEPGPSDLIRGHVSTLPPLPVDANDVYWS